MSHYYMVVTANNTWGRASSLLEAARFASVGNRFEEAVVYRAPDWAIRDPGFSCSPMGDTSWTWSDEVWTAAGDTRVINLVKESFRLGQGLIRIHKNKVELKLTFDE